jgi:homoserine kinase
MHAIHASPAALAVGRPQRPLNARAGIARRRRTVAYGGKSYLDPAADTVSAFGPATVANLGPGFDWLGCAIDGQGDVVTARALEGEPAGRIVIESIRGDGGRLSLEAEKNCAGIAAIETVKLLGAVPSCGIGITLEKGLPLGSGMGSSAASAAASAVAVNALFGNPLSKTALVGPGLVSESTVSGFHADNIAPAVLGGFVLVRSCDPLDLQALTYGSDDLFFVLVNPKFEAPTAEMRAVLPKEVAMPKLVNNCSMGATLVAGILEGDAALVGRALDSDWIIEPVRGPLIPGFMDVKQAAKDSGAFGCTISGAGPTAVAVVPNEEVGKNVMEAMMDAFKSKGGLETNSANIVKLDQLGARVV